MGNYFSESKTITASGVKDGPEGNITDGYSIFQAKSLGDPILSEGGKVHVRQGTRLSLRERPVPSNRVTLFINSSCHRAYDIQPR
jgi:hypothetical protein